MSDYLIHYRTPGSKNGIRKYQYKDGRLTPAGKLRYLKGGIKGTNVGPEYELELEFNSQQNVYPSNDPKPKPKSKPSPKRPTSKADQIDKKIPKDNKKEYSEGYHTWYDEENDTWRVQRRRNPSARKPVTIDTTIGMLANGAKEIARRVIVEPATKIFNAAKEETKKHIERYFENSFDKHFGYQMVPPKGSDSINHLIPYTNKEASEALTSYVNSVSSGSIGNYINSFIQTTQMNVANGCARFLDSIGMDDEVNRFLKKLGIKDNNDMIIDQLKR